MIIASPKLLAKKLDYFKNALLEIGRLEFYRAHFQNRHFNFEPEKFSWEYWGKIPFLTKEDFLKIGLEARLRNAGLPKQENSYLLLRATAGTTRSREPLLIAEKVGRFFGGVPFSGKVLWFQEPAAINLKGVLLSLVNDFDVLVLRPSMLNEKTKNLVSEYRPEMVYSYPSHLVKLASFFPNGLPGVKKIRTGGDFLTRLQYETIQQCFPSSRITFGYALAETGGRIAYPCGFLRTKYGYNAFHPRQRNRLMEIVDQEENGYGEVVVSKLIPSGLALIRYRTGDVARTAEEKCECGAEFTLFLAGRKDFDYIKCAGALITRAELERVMDGLNDFVAEWGAEVREAARGGKFLGELTLKVKPAVKLVDPSILKKQISERIFLTPTKTLATLVQEKKFMPLEIEFVESFPETQKQLLVRKVELA